MLSARSVEEARLYLDLHGCECGERDFAFDHRLEQDGGSLVAVYSGTCPSCGTPRTVTFTLASDLLPAGVIGGPAPSRIIDPGEFLWLSDAAASEVPVDLSGMSGQQLRDARQVMERAIAALGEVVKFIPSGRDDVPVEAFTSELGKELRRERPERFHRSDIEERLRSYQAGLRDFAV
jgi:hypothetical protein